MGQRGGLAPCPHPSCPHTTLVKGQGAEQFQLIHVAPVVRPHQPHLSRDPGGGSGNCWGNSYWQQGPKGHVVRASVPCGSKDPTCPQCPPQQFCNSTYDVIHQVSDGPDEEEAEEWGKEGEPGHRGDLRKGTLTDTVVHTNPPPLTLNTTASPCPPIQSLNQASCVPPANTTWAQGQPPPPTNLGTMAYFYILPRTRLTSPRLPAPANSSPFYAQLPCHIFQEPQACSLLRALVHYFSPYSSDFPSHPSGLSSK